MQHEEKYSNQSMEYGYIFFDFQWSAIDLNETWHFNSYYSFSCDVILIVGYFSLPMVILLLIKWMELNNAEVMRLIFNVLKKLNGIDLNNDDMHVEKHHAI